MQKKKSEEADCEKTGGGQAMNRTQETRKQQGDTASRMERNKESFECERWQRSTYM